MASIQKRLLQDGKTPRWDAYWRDAAGKQHKRTFRRRKDADEDLVEVRKQVQDGTFREVQPTPMSEVFDAWLEHELEVRLKLGDRMKPSTARTYRNIVEKHLRPTFGDIRSDQLSPSVVAKWRRSMADRVADGSLTKKTYNNIHALLGQIVSWAREPAQRYLRHEPLEGIQRMQVGRTERQEAEAAFLEAAQITALLETAAASPEESAASHLGLFGGLRRGELLALRWSDVEVGEDGAGRIHVRRAISGGEVASPKTAYSARAVDVPRDVVDTLAAHRDSVIARAERRVERLAESLRKPALSDRRRQKLTERLAAARRYRDAVGQEDAYLFPSETGDTPADPDNWYSRTWIPLRKRAGLPKGVGLHSLRHTFASLLIHQGENIKYVSRQLGHSSTAFTLDRYGHLFQEAGEGAMGRLQQTIRKAKARRFGVLEGGAK